MIVYVPYGLLPFSFHILKFKNRYSMLKLCVRNLLMALIESFV